MREAIQYLLENEAYVTRNCAIEAKKDLELWQVIQATAILRFLHLVSEGTSKMKASRAVASMLYQKSEAKSFKATSIRHCAKEYLVTGSLVKYTQGKFVKTSSVIFDENVQ
jgi:hypothetical protein